MHNVSPKEGEQRQIADGIKAAALAVAEAEQKAVTADRAPAAIIPPMLQNHDSAEAWEKLKPVHKAGSLGDSTNNPDEVPGDLQPALLMQRHRDSNNNPDGLQPVLLAPPSLPISSKLPMLRMHAV